VEKPGSASISNVEIDVPRANRRRWEMNQRAENVMWKRGTPCCGDISQVAVSARIGQAGASGAIDMIRKLSDVILVLRIHLSCA
jgi:hypothetical protein